MPLQLSHFAASAEYSNETVDSLAMTQVWVWATVDEEMPEEGRDQLTPDMQALCDGVPIFKMKTEILPEKEFMEKINDAGDCLTYYGRKKRDTPRPRAACWICWACRIFCRSGSPISKRSASGNDVQDDLIHVIVGHERVGC